jgi:hypothetical protein
MLHACTPTKTTTESPDSFAPVASSSASPATSAAAAVPSVEKWSGTYVSTVGTLYVFDGGEWATVQWRGDEAGLGLGEGTLSLSIDRKSGAVQGVAGGAIGDATLSGTLSGDTLTASVSRKDPLDRGLTGTAVTKASAERMVGTMHLSVANARVIREASVTLHRENP